MERQSSINFIGNLVPENNIEEIPSRFLVFAPLYKLSETQRQELYEAIREARRSSDAESKKLLNLLFTQIECSIESQRQMKELSSKYKELAKIKISMLEENEKRRHSNNDLKDVLYEDTDYGFEKLKVSHSSDCEDSIDD